MAEPPCEQSGPRADPFQPVALDLRLPEQELHISWADGVKSSFALALLRRHCPCATCRADREKPSPLPILSARQSNEVRVTGGEMVGHYAIRFEWSDGHNTGIYDFRLLRQLHTQAAGLK